MEIKIRKPLSFSEIGRKENQEDALYPMPAQLSVRNNFFILCDGMGGHDSGEVASQTVSKALGEYFEKYDSEEHITKDFFEKALSYAYDELDKKDTGAAKKMGTTMTCLYLHNQGYLVAHIGDSRIYHIRPSETDIKNKRLGIIYQSSDHSLVNDLIKVGELTEEEARNFPNKNIITRAMQPNLGKRAKADVYNFSDIKKGDYFFICCDGVLEQLTNEKLCEILSTDVTDEEKLQAIKEVCDNKTKDNYTCFLVPVDDVILDDMKQHDNTGLAEDDMIRGVSITADNNDEVKVQKKEHNLVPKTKKTFFDRYKKLIFGILVLIILILASVLYVVTTSSKTDHKTEEKEEVNKIEKVEKIKKVDKQDLHEI